MYLSFELLNSSLWSLFHRISCALSCALFGVCSSSLFLRFACALLFTLLRLRSPSHFDSLALSFSFGFVCPIVILDDIVAWPLHNACCLWRMCLCCIIVLAYWCVYHCLFVAHFDATEFFLTFFSRILLAIELSFHLTWLSILLLPLASPIRGGGVRCSGHLWSPPQ
jgi:hypothetical protein